MSVIPGFRGAGANPEWFVGKLFITKEMAKSMTEEFNAIPFLISKEGEILFAGSSSYIDEETMQPHHVIDR